MADPEVARARGDKARPQAPLPAPLLGCLPEDALTEPGWLLVFLLEEGVKNNSSENQETLLRPNPPPLWLVLALFGRQWSPPWPGGEVPYSS